MKKINIFTMLIFLTFSSQAAVIDEQISPHSTQATAQQIEPNMTNPTDYASGQNLAQKIVNASLDTTTEVDWYKVVIPQSDNYHLISINSNIDFKVKIIGAGVDINFEFNKAYHTAFGGAQPYKIPSKAGGEYFVKISSTGQTGDCKFTIGRANYEISAIKIANVKALELTSNKDNDTQPFDITNVPEGAILTTAMFDGYSQGSVSYLTKTLEYGYGYGDKINFLSYYSHVNVSPSRNIKLISGATWYAKITGKVRKSNYWWAPNIYTLTPNIRLTYIFPVNMNNYQYIDDYLNSAW